jgi:hypothetical protein
MLLTMLVLGGKGGNRRKKQAQTTGAKGGERGY